MNVCNALSGPIDICLSSGSDALSSVQRLGQSSVPCSDDGRRRPLAPHTRGFAHTVLGRLGASRTPTTWRVAVRVRPTQWIYTQEQAFNWAHCLRTGEAAPSAPQTVRAGLTLVSSTLLPDWPLSDHRRYRRGMLMTQQLLTVKHPSLV